MPIEYRYGKRMEKPRLRSMPNNIPAGDERFTARACSVGLLEGSKGPLALLGSSFVGAPHSMQNTESDGSIAPHFAQ